MRALTTIFFIIANYLAAAVNVYFWVGGGEHAALGAAMAVVNFGAAQFLTAFSGIGINHAH